MGLMFRWLRSGWLLLWGSRPYSVRSPLSVADAVAALDADRATAWTLVGMSSRGAGLYRVTGWVSAGDVRLTSSRGGRNSMRPVLRARFTAVPGGCELTGSFAAPPLGRAFAALWLAMAVFLPLVVFGRGDLLGALTFLMFSLGMAVLGLATFGIAAWSGRRDEERLRGWVERHLNAV